jgi:hypothetical protein
MIRLTTLAALLMLVAAPAMAATPATCSTSDPSKFQPQQTLIDQLKALNLTVRQIKVEKGCYEVYAVDKAGKKVNTAYNAETLQQVGNAEAGEN